MPIRIAFLLLATLFVVGCSRPPADKAAASASVLRALVTVHATTITGTVDAPGTVIGSEHAVLASQTGGRVTRVWVQAGQSVTRGQLLLAVDPARGQAALAEAEARATAARANAEQAERDFGRYQTLYKEKAVSTLEFENMRRNRDITASAAAAAASALTAARTALGYAEIRAPFAGTVAAKNVQAGDYAAPGAALMVLDGGEPQIETQIGDALFARVQLGDTIEVVADGRTYRARVIERVGAVDPSARTHLVKLAFPVGTKVASGAYASVRFPAAAQGAFLLPASALAVRAGLAGVFVVDATGNAQFRLVRAGAVSGTQVEILAGLSAGEQVVADPGPAFENGTRVTLGPARGR